MHTRIDIMLCNIGEDESKLIGRKIINLFEQLEAVGNYFSSDSELFKLNSNHSVEPVGVSNSLFIMLEYCFTYNKLTKGYFDIAINSNDYNPTTIHNVIFNEEDKTIQRNVEGIKLNLSGFIKGYALDLAKHILQQHNVSDALLNVGNSSIMAIGNHPKGKGWKVGVASMNNGEETNANQQTVLNNECFTTSGNNKEERAHIISPVTGELVKGKCTISVITEKASHGEVLSTALFAAPNNLYKEILDAFGAKLL